MESRRIRRQTTNKNVGPRTSLFAALSATLLFALFTSVIDCWAQPTIYLVRHAEKLANWPGGKLGDFQPLSKKGIARAQKLTEVFKPGSLTAIYSSLTARTLHTAFPLSQALKLPIRVAPACMDTTAIADFYVELSEKYTNDETVLLVSHSNIIPYLLVQAGLPRSCRKKMAFTKPSASGWLLIEGYNNIWKIKPKHGRASRCEGFERIKF